MRRRPGVVAPSPGKPEDKDGAPSQCQGHTDEIDRLEFPKIYLLEVVNIVVTRVTHSRQSPSTFFKGMKNKTHSVVRPVRGRFRRKIHRHESADCDASAPPITGPIPFARATTEPYDYQQRIVSGGCQVDIIRARGWGRRSRG